ncbi:MAG: DUF2130 domain-containing protein [Clostridia bacterium]|nr:DUF2130 domain-containing protein [Clostridia bacterium]
MAEIKCPKCNEVFQVDESDYAQIVRQIRDKEFELEVSRREQALNRTKESELENALLKQKGTQDEKIAEKDRQIAQKEGEIARLKAQLDAAETQKKMAVMEATNEKQSELVEKDNKIIELTNAITLQKTESELQVKSLKEGYDSKLKDKDEQIQYYKDLKARQSVKLLGETLEQHCMNQFNSLRMTAFPNAYFEKDNDARTGSKGDFIFRDYVDGVEYISIMFEMKNEADETKTKHKNEDFFKELDKDRNEKKCEYAVLVSLLESDNDFYNNGIVDVSYKYPKMYVIRPQFFIPIITLLRNAAMNSLQYRRELQIVREQQLDLVHFEENMDTFKTAFARNFDLASRKFEDAISEIDKAISQLQKVKDSLLSSQNNLRLANDKAQDLSIKKLTKNAPSVKKMFDDLKDESEAMN